jgi:hypothetical protein
MQFANLLQKSTSDFLFHKTNFTTVHTHEFPNHDTHRYVCITYLGTQFRSLTMFVRGGSH